jgi:murein DD-endopeptidase MepM/ murein hydrolase activator NlpD
MKRYLNQFVYSVLTMLLCLVLIATLYTNAFAQSPTGYLFESSMPSTAGNSSADGSQSSTSASVYVRRYEAPLALERHDHFLLAQPIEYENIFWTTADYRYGYFVKEYGNLHRGLDLPAIEGTPILASGDGEVVFSGYGLVYGGGAKNDPYGISVKIKHTLKHEGQTIYTVYCHLERSLVKAGQKVTTGQIIGTVGMTGNTSGPHLHYEVRVLGDYGQVYQNPELWLVPAVDHGVIAGRIVNRYGYLLNGWKFILTSVTTGRDWVISAYDPEIIAYHENDSYFRENYVISDIPAGSYQFSMWYNGVYYTSTIEILPGLVNYVNFNGTEGFEKSIPPGSSDTSFLN